LHKHLEKKNKKKFFFYFLRLFKCPSKSVKTCVFKTDFLVLLASNCTRIMEF